MFSNNSDLPCDTIIANFFRLELDGVKANDDGELSTTKTKSLNNNELELVNANSACDV